MSIATTTDANGRLATATSGGGGGADLSTAVIKAPDTDARNQIQPTDPAAKALVLKGAAAQADNLLEVRDSADALLAHITQAGHGLFGRFRFQPSSATGEPAITRSDNADAPLRIESPVEYTRVFDFVEHAEPGNPAANRARLFSRDNGAGKTQLCVRMPTGVSIVLATEA